MQAGSKTIIGKIRTTNEDAVLISPPLFAVADGMGGHKGGEIASRRALEIAEQELDNLDLTDPVRLLASAIIAANESIWLCAEQNAEFRGMGTTVTMALVVDDKAYIGHVGDSRAYLLSPGAFVQLTTDDSLVHELIREGQLSEESARNHPARNIITKAIGTAPKVTPELIAISVCADNKLLLCTDGLTIMLSDDRIGTIIAQDLPPQDICEQLVAEADAELSTDNISLVLLDFCC